MNTKLRIVSLLLALVCLFSLFVGCSPTANYEWSLDELDSPADIHTELQKQYLLDEYTSVKSYAKGEEELSRPLPVRLLWSATPKTDKEPSVLSYTLEIAKSRDFTDAVLYQTTDTYFDVYNLFVGTTYFWRVSAELSGGAKITSHISTFSTVENAPRNLFVEGVTNVRDLGGWATENGGTVTQGLIYRTGRMNESGSDEVVIEITERGIMTLKNELGVKTEIDLRRTDTGEVGSITSSPLGEGVAYYSIPMKYNVDNLLLDNIEAIREIFLVLGDESNYPIVYHCNIGTDRTGLLSFLINGLAGVCEEDLYRDYLFSNFGDIGGSRSATHIQNTYVKTIKGYPGETLSEQIKYCLIANGVSKSAIETVIRMMTEN